MAEERLLEPMSCHETCFLPHMMPGNQKLTKVIAGRTMKVATVEPGAVLVEFDDESRMKIKTAGPATIPSGGKVGRVISSGNQQI